MSMMLKAHSMVDIRADARATDPPTEPPEDGRTCGKCYFWTRCPCGGEWGLCTKENDFIHEDSPKCMYWEEA